MSDPSKSDRELILPLLDRAMSQLASYTRIYGEDDEDAAVFTRYELIVRAWGRELPEEVSARRAGIFDGENEESQAWVSEAQLVVNQLIESGCHRAVMSLKDEFTLSFEGGGKESTIDIEAEAARGVAEALMSRMSERAPGECEDGGARVSILVPAGDAEEDGGVRELTVDRMPDGNMIIWTDTPPPRELKSKIHPDDDTALVIESIRDELTPLPPIDPPPTTPSMPVVQTRTAPPIAPFHHEVDARVVLEIEAKHLYDSLTAQTRWVREHLAIWMESVTTIEPGWSLQVTIAEMLDFEVKFRHPYMKAILGNHQARLKIVLNARFSLDYHGHRIPGDEADLMNAVNEVVDGADHPDGYLVSDMLVNQTLALPPALRG